MKASELIKALEELIEHHGDLDVGYDCGYGGIEDVVYVATNNLGHEMDCFTVN